jgi:hypothetical protein
MVLKQRIIKEEDQFEKEVVRERAMSEITIHRVAQALKVESEQHIASIEFKFAGNACVEAGHYKQASQHFALALGALENGSDEGETSLASFAPTGRLRASLYQCCASARVLHACMPELGTEDKVEWWGKAAADAFVVLSASSGRDDSNGGGGNGSGHSVADRPSAEVLNHATIQGRSSQEVGILDLADVMALVVGCAAGVAQRGYIPTHTTHACATDDKKVLVQCCMAIGDAWGGLSSCIDGDAAQRDILREGALVAYRSILELAAAVQGRPGGRLVRAKDRRRMEKATAALSTPAPSWQASKDSTS